jgi:thiamine biosynthesis lipoprotein
MIKGPAMKNKYATGTLLLVIAIFLLVSCERTGDLVEDSIDVLGTFGQITLVGIPKEKIDEVVGGIERDLQALDDIGYTFEEQGELARLNDALANGRSMTVSDDMLELIKSAIELFGLSGGLFNPAAGELTAFWEFVCDRDTCSESPYPEAVQRLVDKQIAKIISRKPSIDDLIISGNKISSRNRQVRLEFGDMIRGLALDKGIEHLKSLGIDNAMINIGGSARTIGTRGDHDWWIGIPDATGEHYIGSIENIDDQSVVTVRAFDKSTGKQGVVYRHIIDPRTGQPVRDVVSVTVMHDSALIANASAVTLHIAGIEEWKKVADSMDTHKILLITKDGTLYASPAMADVIHWKQGVEFQYLVP